MTIRPRAQDATRDLRAVIVERMSSWDREPLTGPGRTALASRVSGVLWRPVCSRRSEPQGAASDP
jgi:hypothetical protein